MATLRNDSKRAFTLPKRGDGKAAFGGDGLAIGAGQTMTVTEAYADELRREPGLAHLVIGTHGREKSA